MGVINNIKGDDNIHPRFDPVLKKLSNLSEIIYVTEKPKDVYTFISNNVEYYIPLKGIDIESEKKKIEEDLKYTHGFMLTKISIPHIKKS